MTSASHMILIDLDGTLVDYETAAREEHAAVASLIGTYIGTSFAAHAMHRFDGYLVSQHCEVDTGEISVAEFRRRRLRYALLPWADPSDDLSEAVAACASKTADTVTLIDGGVEALAVLRDAGHALAIVTNGPRDIQHGKCQRLGIDRFVNTVITSQDTGYVKPDRRMFHLAIGQLGGRPSHATMIGDSWRNDILGALHAGVMQAIQIGSRPCGRAPWQPGYLGSVATLRDAVPLLLRDQP